VLSIPLIEPNDHRENGKPYEAIDETTPELNAALKELKSGFRCIGEYSSRGRKPSEYHLPNLLDDIQTIVEAISRVDPTFRTDQDY
jgi:hypothetical protein